VEEGCIFVFLSDIYLVAKSIQFQIYRIKTTPAGKGRGRCDKLIPSSRQKSLEFSKADNHAGFYDFFILWNKVKEKMKRESDEPATAILGSIP
jgi:hypothetical protein